MADEWWSKPYKGGPMVAVPGFPRPLYFPDNPDGHEASEDGPDVVAYKRTVSRAKRWPWQTFDDSYSRSFAQGKSGGNVGESGVAGVQRQQAIDATGYVGKATFNTLRSIRCPPGPHEGQMAMDANAANLIAEAYARYHPPPPPKETTRERALDGAAKWLGTTESPSESNCTPFGRWYGVDGQPWCAIFVTYCYEVEAGGSPSFAKYVDGNRWAYVPYIVSDARANRNGLHATTSPQPGDLCCFDWQGDGTFDHVGLFSGWESQSQGSFQTIEGNTSPDNDSNGGEVMRRDRNLRSASIVFARVDEP